MQKEIKKGGGRRENQRKERWKRGGDKGENPLMNSEEEEKEIHRCKGR